MLANEFSAFEHSPLFFVDIIIHCSLLRTCRVRVEEKEEFLVYTVLWILTCHPYLESATALSDSVFSNFDAIQLGSSPLTLSVLRTRPKDSFGTLLLVNDRSSSFSFIASIGRGSEGVPIFFFVNFTIMLMNEKSE